MLNRTNSKPWIPPTIRTKDESSAMYFIGIAINNNTINDIPSRKAINLRRPMFETKYFDMFVISFTDVN